MENGLFIDKSNLSKCFMKRELGIYDEFDDVEKLIVFIREGKWQPCAR